MRTESASVTIVTDRLAETRQFYEAHFDAWASFDCGWYVVLKLGRHGGAPEFCLMEPRDGAQPYAGGLVLNLVVDDVEAAHAAVTAAGLTPAIPLEDHPWGDRGFGIVDPAGVMVYCHVPIEPSDAFKPYFRQIPDRPPAG